MAELWSVHVESVASTSVTFSVEAVHPDSGPFPVTRRFALDLLFDHKDALVPDGFEFGAVGDAAEAEAAALVSRLDVVAVAQAQVQHGVTYERARYVVEVTEPACIEHLRVGDTWDTAAFSDSGPYVGRGAYE
jgi:hypothetical protein